MPTIPTGSREYLYVREVVPFDLDSPDAGVDPATLDALAAFLPPGIAPTDDSWHPAEWSDSSTIRVLVGGDLALGPGTYVVWLRIVGSIERPSRNVGQLTVE